MNKIILKENPKNQLKGKYKDAIILLVLYVGVTFVTTIVGNFLGTFALAVDLVVNGLLFFGYTSFFLKISRGQNTSYQEPFSRTIIIISTNKNHFY